MAENYMDALSRGDCSNMSMKMWKYVLWAMLLLFSTEFCQSVKILGILPVVSKSHYSITRRVMTTLALRGHQVTVISGIEEKQTFANYTHIYLSEGLFDAVDTISVQHNNLTEVTELMKFTEEIAPERCALIFRQDHMKEIISSKLNAYDVIVTEFVYYPCYLALAANLNVPVIWFDAHGLYYSVDYFTGNPNNPAYIPSIVSGLSSDMSFIERLMNFYEISVIHYYQANIFVPAAVNQFNKLHNTHVTLNHVYQLPDLALVYSHFTLLSRPSLPQVVEIGGIHIEEEKPLPQDIKEFIDKAEYGVIFFSFGTTLKCDSIPEKKMQMFKEVFSKIKQRVLWRCNIASQVTVPDNVMVRYWFPQRDILAHKNVRTFISHGGLLGIYEAIYTATPLIGIPFIYDQCTDIRLLEKTGAIIHLNFQDLTADVLFDSINKIINNSKYKENMERLSVIFKDRPMSPLDTAIYWVEYVIRHKGASHLRSPAAGMPLYRYLLLDVIGFLAICILLTLYIASRLICKLSALVFRYNPLRNHSR